MGVVGADRMNRSDSGGAWTGITAASFYRAAKARLVVAAPEPQYEERLKTLR